MITSGQFVAYFADYCFTFVPGTWRWMLGVAAAPALLQAAGLLGLPESPKCVPSLGFRIGCDDSPKCILPTEPTGAGKS